MKQTIGNKAVQRLLVNQRQFVRRLGVQRDETGDGEAQPVAKEEKVAVPSAIGYIGMNPAAAKEAKALKYVSKDQVLISLDDPEAQKGLITDHGVGKFVYKELGIDPSKDVDKFIKAYKTLKAVGIFARDQMGHMMKWFRGAEQGKYTLERLVLSGHSDGVNLWGDSEDDHEPGSFLLHRDLANIAGVFPKAAGQVQDIMFSACWSVVAIKKMTEIFPNLQTAWGYIGFSPSIGQGSARHIQKWEMTTRGDKTPKKRDRRGKAAIWTRADGYVAGSPADFDLKELKDHFNANVPRTASMYEGNEELDGGFLRDLYFTLQLISIHPEATSAEIKQARDFLEKTLRLRYWNVIISKFRSNHADVIAKAYKGFPVADPKKAGYKNRGRLKAHIEEIKAELGKKAHADMSTYVTTLLEPGLWELKPEVIPDEWI